MKTSGDKRGTGRPRRTDVIFSRQLSKIMYEQSVTPGELSARTGLPRGLIYRYLSSDVSPGTINLRKLALTLDVSADFLLGIRNENAKNL